MKYTKIDDHTLQVEKAKMVERPSETEKETTTYEYGFLLSQKEAITAQRDALIAVKTEELAKVDSLIAEANKLGIKEKEEAVEEEEEIKNDIE